MDHLADVVILCGGRGTRLQEHTQSIPKPLVEIGDKPIVWHVIQIYAAQGFQSFVLATGYMGEQIEAFVRSNPWPLGVEVRCVDTGLDTPTGERIRRVGRGLDGRAFCATYADGVADIDLAALAAFHREHGALSTLTVVRPRVAVRRGRAERRRQRPGLRREAPPRALDQRRLLLLRGRRAGVRRQRTRYSNGSRSSDSRRPASSTPSVMRASGSAWTPIRIQYS